MEIVYLGDAARGNTTEKLLIELNINFVNSNTKPDMILFDRSTDEIFVVETVFTTGHIDTVRLNKLREIFDSKSKLVFVTAVESRKYIRFPKVFKELAWGTSLWVAEHPTGLIKFIEYDSQDG